MLLGEGEWKVLGLVLVEVDCWVVPVLVVGRPDVDEVKGDADVVELVDV